MTDINPDVPDKPIEIAATPAAEQAGTLARDVLLVVSTLPALTAVLGTHDVAKIVAYLTSSAFAPAAGVLALAGVIGWRQWNARRRNANDKKMASATPDSVAVIKGA